MTSITSTPVNKAKHSLLEMTVKNNYYIVQQDLFQHYFPIKVQDENSNLFRFLKAPSVLMPGIAVIDKQFYTVTLEDLKRGIVRKYRLLQRSVKNATPSSSANSTSVSKPDQLGQVLDVSTIGLQETVLDSDERAACETAGMEPTNKLADATWEGQIQALLNTISEKEGGEWEIASAP